jgi:psiF repeat-containing protein
MLRYVSVLGLLIAVLANTSALALTKQQKLETCTFGADDQKLTGQARKTFMTRCMANEDRPAVRAAPQQPK